MREKTINLETEKYVLGCLLKYQKNLYDFLPEVKKEWFASKTHSSIFEGMAHLAVQGEFSKLSLLEYFSNLGIKDFEDVGVNDYLEVLSTIFDLDRKNFKIYVASLKKYYVARTAHDAASELQYEISKSLNEPIEKIVSIIQSGFADVATSEVADSIATTDLFGSMEDLLEEEEIIDGIKLPFPDFYKMYGGLVPGNCYGFTAGYGDGKSTMLDYIAKKCPLMPENNCRVLYLDTELSPKQNLNRFLSCLTGENEYLFRTGKWKNDPELEAKVRGHMKAFKKHEHKYHYKTVEQADAKDIIAIVRRWCHKHVKEGEIPLIIYDYMKVTGEKIDNAWDEYNLLGEKTNALNQLARELNAAIVFACQTNSDGKTASSRKILFFVSNMFNLRSKTQDELLEHGEEFGTHILEAEKTRQQGEDAVGFNKFVKVPDNGGKHKFVKNFLNYDFKNFRVKEKGTLVDILNKKAENLTLQD